MRPSTRFLQACRITLFTRANCALCTNARTKLSNVWDSRPFLYKEIDVLTPEGRIWRDYYEFDTPVIHVSGSKNGEEVPELASKAKKLMHRFTAEEVMEKMDEVEKENPPDHAA